MKKRKPIWIALVCVLLAAAIIGGCVYWFIGRTPDPVTVYGIEECWLYSYNYDYSGYSDGIVSTDRFQAVALSATQEVTEIFVQQGQAVTKGQKLLAYDTTLSQLSLDRQKLDIEKSKLRLEDAKRQLAEIRKMKPISYNPGTTPPTTKPTTAPSKPTDTKPSRELDSSGFLILGGTGTPANPCVIWVRDGLEFDTTEHGTVSKIMEGKDSSLYAIVQVREKDKAAGEVVSQIGVLFRKTLETIAAAPSTPPDETEPTDPTDPSDPTDPTEPEPTEPVTVTVTRYSFSFFDAEEEIDPVTPDPEPAPGPSIDMNSGYTSGEIAQMRAEKEAEIKEMEFNIKMAEAEYKIMQKEFDNGVVTAETDGYVSSVLTPEEALATGEPIVKVSGGGGFLIQGSVSELMLDKLSIGQQVQVESWETGICTGTITEIGDYPVEGSFFGGNPNTSYYPFTVSVDESAGLRAGSYVSITYGQQNMGSGSMYLETSFLRSENGAYYVYVRGEGDLLEKRPVQVGGIMSEGYYTEILSGLTTSDYIAFPYGKGLKEGAPTVVGTSEDLYGGMYY